MAIIRNNKASMALEVGYVEKIIENDPDAAMKILDHHRFRGEAVRLTTEKLRRRKVMTDRARKEKEVHDYQVGQAKKKLAFYKNTQQTQETGK